MLLLLQVTLQSYQAGLLIGAIMGFIIGLIPLILGLIKKKRKYAMFGFLGSFIGNAIMGIILSIPIAGIFTWLILRNNEEDRNIDEESADIEIVDKEYVNTSAENSENL